MRSFFQFLYVVLSVVGWFKCGGISVTSLILLLFVVVLGTVYISTIKSLRNYFCSAYVFFYLFCCHTVTLAFPDFFKIGDNYKQTLWVFVNILNVIFFLTAILFQRKKIGTNSGEGRIFFKPVMKMHWNILIVLMFSLSIISFSLGLSKMGTAQDVRLPFHLAGIINNLRMKVIPVLYMFFLIRDYASSSGKKFNKYFVIYVLWLFVETFVRLSRGVLVASVIDMVIIFVMVGSFKLKEMKRFIPIGIAALMLFPIVSSLRSITGDNKLSSQDITKAASQNTAAFDEVFRESYLRMFSTVSFYDRTYYIVNSSTFFDFSRAPIIYNMGGSHYYITSEVDQRGLDEGHNSGSTGVIDSLLFGGYGFCYIVFFISVLLILSLDTKYLIQRPFVRYILFGIFIWFIRYRTVSYFLDQGVAVQLFVSGLLLFYFIRYYQNTPRRNSIVTRH